MNLFKIVIITMVIFVSIVKVQVNSKISRNARLGTRFPPMPQNFIYAP